jgi:diadenosine tetraphosphatase ApaH/serine/threonine PP2A family protein phosphatase
MRYAIFSDIHGNLNALDAVLSAFKKEKPDKYLCVGDIVGYGAEPSACIERVKSLNADIIMGNHEAASTGLFPIDNFNPYARSAVIWTRQALSREDIDFLKNLPLIFENEDLIMVHGSLDSPEEFRYIFEAIDTEETFSLMKKKICFIAHTHRPKVYVKRDVIISQAYGQRIEINDSYKYVVNTGSVGQPRDRDARAAYCIYDTEEKTVEIKRVTYNIGEAQKKIIRAGLPSFLAERLGVGY